MSRELKGNEIRGKKFDKENLSDYKFVKCDLTDVSFENCDLSGAVFIDAKCTKPAPNFEGANLSKSHFENCKLRNVILSDTNFSDSRIEYCDFSGGRLNGVNFNNSNIDETNIANCNLHMASFIYTKINKLNFKPILKIPFLRGYDFINFNKKGLRRTIFISQNEHSSFTDFCRAEARKDKLFAILENQGKLNKIMTLLFLSIFGLVSDFGNSLSRLIMSSIIIIIFFGAMYKISNINLKFHHSIIKSILVFFNNLNHTNLLPPYYAVESTIGIFMIGILISVLINKLFIS